MASINIRNSAGILPGSRQTRPDGQSRSASARRWNQIRSRNSESESINVGDEERWLSAAAGGALAAYGLTRGSLSGLAVAALGGCLVWRGVSGHCQMYNALG